MITSPPKQPRPEPDDAPAMCYLGNNIWPSHEPSMDGRTCKRCGKALVRAKIDKP